MANDRPEDRSPDTPSLEAPSLGRLLGRRRGKQAPAAAPEVPTTPRGGAAPPPAAEETAALPSREPVQEPVQEPVPPVPPPAQQAPRPPAPPVTVDADPAPRDERPSRPSRPRLQVDGRVAAAVVGLLVGLLVVALTAGALQLCEAARGVSSCGGGPGFSLLLAVVVSMVALGGVLLRAAGVPDPVSTSFLAVGLLCVVALLFLVESLDQWWVVVVIPAVSVATFLLSHWVTTAVVDADG